MEFQQDDRLVLIRLDRGEDLFKSLTSLAKQQHWHAAQVSGIGALNSVELGYFQIDQKDYKRHPVESMVELLSLEGNLCELNGDPFFHLHAVLGSDRFECIGGHLFSATVAVTAEIYLHLFNQPVYRAIESTLKFNQMQFCPMLKLDESK